MSILFRWSVWGDKRQIAVMLPLSIATFRRAFGTEADYVVCTDEPGEMTALLGPDVEVRPLVDGSSSFSIESGATWKKWCPSPRLRPESTEFYVDSDIFLVGDPNEIKRFCFERSPRCFLVMQEAPRSKYYVGTFAMRVLSGLPPVNAGFLGQRAGADISSELLSELSWWQQHIPAEQRQYHDDQGAVVTILARRYLIGQVELLPQDRYRIISPRKNTHLSSLEGIAALHATGGHAAFKRFEAEIERFAFGGMLIADGRTRLS